MKMSQALRIIKSNEKKISKRKSGKEGYMVSFEEVRGSILASGHFPDKHAGEKLIKTEDEAWNLAKRFADASGPNYVNIYVIGKDFCPVAGYDKKELKKYW